jgi:hypothetical protein
VLSLDTDPLRASALRAAIESLGARLVSVEAKAQLQQQFRTLLPHVAVIDASHEEAASVASTIDQQGGSVAIITVGEGRVSWSGERLPEGAPFSALLVACAHALRSTLGPDDVTVAEHGASTQTLKLSRADVRSMINARKEPSKP